MRCLIIAILLGFILCPLIHARQPEEEVKKSDFVMILSSYSYEKEWSTALAKEIRNQLETRDSLVKVNITYADIAARTSYIADRFAMQGAFANGRINNQIAIPRLLILIGDESWMIYRNMSHVGRWPTVPILLCGMHDEIMEDYETFFAGRNIPDGSLISLQSSDSVLSTAAVMEPDNAAQTIALAKTLLPGLKQLYYLSDGGYADTYMKKKLLTAMDSTHCEFSLNEIRQVPSNADSVRQVLGELPRRSILLTNGSKVPETVRVPVLTLRDMEYGDRIPAGGYFATIADFARKAADETFRILNATEGKLSYVYASDTTYYLNQTALLNAGLASKASQLTHASDRNIPSPFLLRHIRVVSAVLLILIVALFFAIRMVHSRRHSRSLQAMFLRYKSLYDEYQVVYENMPIGLMLFDIYGNLLNRNAETDAFFEQFAHSTADVFQLYSSGILDEDLREALFRKELVSRMLTLKAHSYRILLRMIADEETGDNNILVLVIDNTDIENEKKAKEQIYSVFNSAMNKAVIGVAEYNLLDDTGFATNAWYDILGIERPADSFAHVHRHLVPEDCRKVEDYLMSVRHGATLSFLSNLQVCLTSGAKHYVRYFIQPIETAPEKGRIIVAELIVNMDAEIKRTHELQAALRKAQEADRLKNAFVVNMGDEIREPLKAIVDCARELANTDSRERRPELNNCIEKNNQIMLNLLQHIIKASKEEAS